MLPVRKLPKVTQLVFLTLEFMFLPTRQRSSPSRTSGPRWALSDGVLVCSVLRFDWKKLIRSDGESEPVSSPKSSLIFSHPFQEQPHYPKKHHQRFRISRQWKHSTKSDPPEENGRGKHFKAPKIEIISRHPSVLHCSSFSPGQCLDMEMGRGCGQMMLLKAPWEIPG